MASKSLREASSQPARLTQKQFRLLGLLLVESIKGDQFGPIIWSPKKLLGRSPTRAESSALSTRLKTLVGQGLVKRFGREVTVTELGKTALWSHATNKGASGDAGDLEDSRAVLSVLKVIEAREQKKAIAVVLKVISDQEMPPASRQVILSELTKAAQKASTREEEERLVWAKAWQKRAQEIVWETFR